MMITTRSTVACIKYLIENGFHFVLTRKFSSDDVEGIFSAVRALQGYNDQADAIGSIYALETILKTGIFSGNPYGDCATGGSSISALSSNKNIDITGREMPAGTVLPLNSTQEKLARLLPNLPDIRNVTIKNAGVAMVAGFTLRLLKDKHGCEMAANNMTGSSDEYVNKLIFLQDRGGLLYPSKSYVCLVKLIFDILQGCSNMNFVDALVKSWKITVISRLPPNILECGCGDMSHKAKIRDLVVGSLCKIYFYNNCQSLTDLESTKPKFELKPLPKKVKKL